MTSTTAASPNPGGSEVEEPVTGITTGQRLLHRVSASPDAPLIATVVGPGGTGKSTLLRAIARAYGDVGVVAGAEDGPVLVDDAHLIGGGALRRLGDLAASCRARLVVAHRPWPIRPELTALQATVARHGVTVGLGRLDRDGVRRRVARLLGEDPDESTVAAVYEQSAGLPLLVEAVVCAVGGASDRRPLATTPLSASAVERWRHLVDAVPDDVRLVLEALAIGADPRVDELVALTGLAAGLLPAAMEAAKATGYVDGNGRLAPFARALLLAAAPVLRLRQMQEALVSTGLDRRGPVLRLARRLLGSGISGAAAAAMFEAAADEALLRSPVVAADLYSGAVMAGGDPGATAARRCGTAALAGDLDLALRLADTVLADPAADAHDRTAATATAAAVLAHRGFPERSAAQTLALPADHPTGPVWAVPALLGVGNAAAARRTLEAATAGGSGGLGGEAGILVATSLLAAVDGDPHRALTGLARAAVLLEPIAATTLLPDTPAALAALVALQTGEAGVADFALRRAAAGNQGGGGARLRHLLLHGWVLLLRGRFRAAQEALDRAGAPNHLQPRDELFAAALHVALARRSGSASMLADAWGRARPALLNHSVDLHTLLPLGELTVAAALLHDDAHLAPHLDDAHQVLRDLGDPVLWAAPLHWAEAQAAVAAGRREQAECQVEALDRAASTSSYSAALAAAARVWVHVRWRVVDQEAAIHAARGLAAVGLPWEGAKLAGQAAAHTEERGAAALLHTCARELFRSTDGGEEAEPVPAPDPDAAPGLPTSSLDDAALSERELEVGRLILNGLTYRQIGEQLYISAKTVENHVARMRRRLGASSRNELFDRLRALIAAAS